MPKELFCIGKPNLQWMSAFRPLQRSGARRESEGKSYKKRQKENDYATATATTTREELVGK